MNMDFTLYTLARSFHVAAIVGWIGGVWFVTLVVMPAITRSEPPASRLAAFHQIEQGFSAPVSVFRAATMRPIASTPTFFSAPSA